jgi:hypothetical protein
MRAAAAGPLPAGCRGPIAARQAPARLDHHIDLDRRDGPTRLSTRASLSFPAVPLTQRPAMVDGGLAAAGGGSWLARFTARRPRPLTSRPANNPPWLPLRIDSNPFRPCLHLFPLAVMRYETTTLGLLHRNRPPTRLRTSRPIWAFELDFLKCGSTAGPSFSF